MFCQNSDYISIVISLGALGLSLFTFLSERVRLRKEATLHAYLKIQTETIKRLKEVDKGENSFINLDKRRYYNSSTSRLHCAARVSRLSCGFSRDQNEIDWGDLQTPDASSVWIIVNHKDFEYPRYIPHSLRQINKQMCA